ncbi:MAG: DNA polymerase I [Oscillospiraceae bacterium]
MIDGNSILSRTFYGIRPLTALDGTPTNAVYGFLNILLKHIDECNPDYLCVAFDLKAPTFRHKMYDQYKAQRKPTPNDFLIQVPIIKEILEAMNFVCLEKEGYEADDIIGTVSRICEENDISCDILTGDKDDLQLASDLTKIKLVITRMGNSTTTLYGYNEVLEKYAVTPTEFIDVKGLMGDTSDNIPGVKGVGEKTAFSLIQNYKSIENIYENISEIDVTDSVRKKLQADKDNAFMSKILATIDRFVPIEINIEEFSLKEYNAEKLSALLTRYNLKSLMTKLNISPLSQPKKLEKVVDLCVEKLDEASALGKLTMANTAYYVLDYAEKIPVVYFSLDGENFFYVMDSVKFLTKFFSMAGIKKIGFNLKDDIVNLKKCGVDFEGLGFDVMIAAYIINPVRSKYEIETLCFEYLGIDITNDYKVCDDGQISMSLELETPEKSEKSEKSENQQCVNKLSAMIKLEKFLRDEIEKCGQHELYYDIELPLVEVLADMQIKGVYVDIVALKEFGSELQTRLSWLTSEIYEEAGETFNINSPKQLGVVLFENMGLPHGKKTKTGYSTNVDVLEKLKDTHRVIEYILEYRHVSKLYSTYVKGLLSVIDSETGRIHSNFNQTVTATGRISSTEPNLQNIPVRTELGREIRRMFTAEGENETLVDADYSQIELRVLAHISEDKMMKSAFTNEIDIHTQTASQVFGVPLEDVSSIMRTRAKAVNFGIVYGIGAFSLAQDLKISRKEADEYIKGYLNNYPSVESYMKTTIEKAKENGYVSTMFGRRRYMPELIATNKNTQAFGERVAMNAPIQGSAADIIKIAMVNVHKRLKLEGLESKLILQVHDELIIEAKKDELDRVRLVLKEEMENACKLSVPLIVDMKDGHAWYDTK